MSMFREQCKNLSLSLPALYYSKSNEACVLYVELQPVENWFWLLVPVSPPTGQLRLTVHPDETRHLTAESANQEWFETVVASAVRYHEPAVK